MATSPTSARSGPRQNIVTFEGVRTGLGISLSTLSILVILKHAFYYGPGPTLYSILSYYERLSSLLFDWARSPLEQSLGPYFEAIGIHLRLERIWKHVFVLLGLYFFSDAATAAAPVFQRQHKWELVKGTPKFDENIYTDVYIGRTNIRSAIFYAVAGFIIALLAAIGVSASQSIVLPFWKNLFTALIPLSGILFYDLTVGVWDAIIWKGASPVFFERLPFPLFRFFSGLAVLAVSLNIDAVRQLPNPGLAIIAAILIMIACIFMIYSLRFSSNPRFNVLKLPFWNFEFWRLGSAMLIVAAAVGTVVLLNAGLSILGL